MSNVLQFVGLLDKRAVYDMNGGGLIITGLFNIDSRQVTETASFKYVNIADGVLLAEVFRYSVKRSNSLLGMNITAYLIDNRESFPPYASFFFYPYISAIYNWQIAPYLLVRKRQKSAPFINVFPFSKTKDVSIGDTSRFSVVPYENYEVDAITDLLVKLKWKYVSIVASLDNENQETAERFKRIADKRGICIDTTVQIPISPSSKDLTEAVQKLKGSSNATVVVLLANSISIHGLLQSDLRGFSFLSGTKLRASRNGIKFKSETAKGLLLLQNVETYDEGFKNYFLNLTLSSNGYSWFGEFWSEIFQCNIPNKYRSKFGTYKNIYNKTCTGQEKLTEDKVDFRFALVKPVMNAVQSIVCALKGSKEMRACDLSYFPQYASTCGRLIMVNSSDYILRGNCQLMNSDNLTNSNEFHILNYDGASYSKVGRWLYNVSNGKGVLHLKHENISWNRGEYRVSTCYSKCKLGEVEDRGGNAKICCYKCQKCKADEIIANNSCIKCLEFQVPDQLRSRCLPLPLVSISSQSEATLFLQVGAIVGIAIALVAVVMCVKYRRSRIVKSTGRELSFFIMLSIIVCFSSSFIFFLRPSSIVCGVQKIILSQCLSCCYIPLLLKTVRVYRVFQASKKLVRNPSYVSTRSQVVMCLIGIVANFLLGVFLIISSPAEVMQELIDGKKKVAVLCMHNPVHAITSLIPCIVLMLTCTYFGYKTRRFPSNFNESFRVSITMYISCFLWAMFVPLLYVFQLNRSNVFLTNLTTAGLMIILGYVNFFGLFGATLIQVLVKNDLRPDMLTTASIQQSVHVTTTRTKIYPVDISIAGENTGSTNGCKTSKKAVKIYLPDIGN